MALDGDSGYEWEDSALKARYAGMAESYKPFARVLSGEATMRGTLDTILGGIEADAKLTKSTSPHLEEFEECAAFLLSYYLDGEVGGFLTQSYTGHAEALLNRKWNTLKSVGGVAVAVAGLVAWFIPPLDIPAYAVYIAGWTAHCATHRKAKWGRQAKDNREGVFSPLYRRADVLDEEVGRAFLVEHFHSARERFGETYASLNPDEQQDVRERLMGQLSAGALDMGEAELDRYLSSLTEEGVAPDA